jgi:ADP-ribosylglycohydrolase
MAKTGLAILNDFKKGILLAVNHSGDSDSTGAITGNILGCLMGHTIIPEKWAEQVELKTVLQDLAIDLWIKFTDNPYWWEKYPAW